MTHNVYLEIDKCPASLVAQTVKNLSAMPETRVWSMGRKDPLEKEMVPHSSTIAWKIPWTEEPGRLQSMGSQRVGHDWATPLFYNKYMQTKCMESHGVSKYTIQTAYVVLSRISCIITIFWINIQIKKNFFCMKRATNHVALKNYITWATDFGNWT